VSSHKKEFLSEHVNAAISKTSVLTLLLLARLVELFAMTTIWLSSGLLGSFVSGESKAGPLRGVSRFTEVTMVDIDLVEYSTHRAGSQIRHLRDLV